MKVILRENISGLGAAGDIKEVADGYARNFLFPRGKVLAADASNLRRWENEKKAMQKKQEEELAKAKEFALQLEKLSCTIPVKTGENKKMFGSITPAHIADALKDQGHTVEKKDILLREPIRELGAYVIDLRVSHSVIAKLKVWVVEQE
ncbi:MAG: 50S ribosomal protein L9 [Elusimicrobia bacterium]|nr:50S ribosomal protein L9 [Elusimicrobiota bacterium]MBD3412012.1 50S ribosomal protein L9 [Elusimicrobiota bacterium]